MVNIVNITGVGVLPLFKDTGGIYYAVLVREKNKGKHYERIINAKTNSTNYKYYEDFGGKVESSKFRSEKDFAIQELFEESLGLFSFTHDDLIHYVDINYDTSTAFRMYLCFLNSAEISKDPTIISQLYKRNSLAFRTIIEESAASTSAGKNTQIKKQKLAYSETDGIICFPITDILNTIGKVTVTNFYTSYPDETVGVTTDGIILSSRVLSALQAIRQQNPQLQDINCVIATQGILAKINSSRYENDPRCPELFRSYIMSRLTFTDDPRKDNINLAYNSGSVIVYNPSPLENLTPINFQFHLGDQTSLYMEIYFKVKGASNCFIYQCGNGIHMKYTDETGALQYLILGYVVFVDKRFFETNELHANSVFYKINLVAHEQLQVPETQKPFVTFVELYKISKSTGLQTAYDYVKYVDTRIHTYNNVCGKPYTDIKLGDICSDTMNSLKCDYTFFQKIAQIYSSRNQHHNEDATTTEQVYKFVNHFNEVNNLISAKLKDSYPHGIILTRPTQPYEFTCLSCGDKASIFQVESNDYISFNQLLFTAEGDCFMPTHFLEKGPGVIYKIFVPNDMLHYILPLHNIGLHKKSYKHYKEVIIHPAAKFKVTKADMDTIKIVSELEDEDVSKTEYYMKLCISLTVVEMTGGGKKKQCVHGCKRLLNGLNVVFADNCIKQLNVNKKGMYVLK